MGINSDTGNIYWSAIQPSVGDNYIQNEIKSLSLFLLAEIIKTILAEPSLYETYQMYGSKISENSQGWRRLQSSQDQ